MEPPKVVIKMFQVIRERRGILLRIYSRFLYTIHFFLHVCTTTTSVQYVIITSRYNLTAGCKATTSESDRYFTTTSTTRAAAELFRSTFLSLFCDDVVKQKHNIKMGVWHRNNFRGLKKKKTKFSKRKQKPNVGV